MSRSQFRHEPGKCQVCADQGILPSEAIACYLHSEYEIGALKAEIFVLRDQSSASSRLHLALAELDGSIPSVDGLAELESVREDRARLERIRTLLEHVLAVANCDADVTSNPPAIEGGGDTRPPRQEEKDQ